MKIIVSCSPPHNTLCSCTSSSWCGPPVVALPCLHISPISASCRTSFFVVFWGFFSPPKAKQRFFLLHRGAAGTLACKRSSSVQEEIAADHCWVSSSSWMHCLARWWPVREFSSPHYLSASPSCPPLALLLASPLPVAVTALCAVKLILFALRSCAFTFIRMRPI